MCYPKVRHGSQTPVADGTSRCSRVRASPAIQGSPSRPFSQHACPGRGSQSVPSLDPFPVLAAPRTIRNTRRSPRFLFEGRPDTLCSTRRLTTRSSEQRLAVRRFFRAFHVPLSPASVAELESVRHFSYARIKTLLRSGCSPSPSLVIFTSRLCEKATHLGPQMFPAFR